MLDRILGAAKFYAKLPQRHDRLLKQVETLASEVRGLTSKLDTVERHEQQLRAIMAADAAGDERVVRFQALLDEERLARHVQKSIARAVLQSDPFPYCIVDDLFPGRYYDALVEAIPPVELFSDLPVNKQQLTVPFSMAPRFSQIVWAHMADVATTNIVAPAVIDKFREPLVQWLQRSFPATSEDPLRGIEMKCTDGRIMLRRPGYRIPPHRDPKWGFITCLMYLARPGDDEKWGTQIFRVADDREARGANPHWIAQQQCAWVADVEFRPNRVLVFLNSEGAHGAHIPEDAQPPDLERYTYQFRLGPERQSIDALRSSLTPEQQPMWAGKGSSY